MTPKWYLKRLASMTPSEVGHRLEDAARRRWWKSRPPAEPAPRSRRRLLVVPDELTAEVSEPARDALLQEAEDLLTGRWTMFGRTRSDVADDVDYFLDFVNGTRAPDSVYCFDIDHRDEAVVGNIKYVWELGRHQHLSLLAAAYALSGDDRFAERVDAELRNYWTANPFLVGIHWTSGIELGLRLISWTWIRRLLDGWPQAPSLFEDNPVFVDQLGRHQQWLASFGGYGSSANNHLIAEACGQFVAASAFGLFEESDRWRLEAADTLAYELELQTFPDGFNRELASAYHGFVIEMALAAWAEAVICEHEIAESIRRPLARAFYALHACVDVDAKPHRQGDSDDAHGWLVDPIGYDHWASLLRTAPLLTAPADWWFDQSRLSAERGSDVRSALLTRCVAGGERPADDRSNSPRPSHFPDAGLTILRDLEPQPTSGEPELWCVFDHGPHGYLSTAAHAHADALAVEIRAGGVEIVSDPGTYCYHGETRWRDHFRSTAAHATLAINGADQSEIGGPFLWTRRATSTLLDHRGLEAGTEASCRAEHDGYRDLGVIHRRSVSLDRSARRISIVDTLVTVGEVGGPWSISLGFPLGPQMSAKLIDDGNEAELWWPGSQSAVRIQLDSRLSWELVCGLEDPPTGWYSTHFGTKDPSAMLTGRSPSAEAGVEYATTFEFSAAS